jgi:hypothetical protein
MKATWKIVTSLAALTGVTVLLAALGLGQPAYAASCNDDKRVMGGNFVLEEGATLDSNLIVLGGNATLEPGTTVNCSVIVVGGNMEVAGRVAEDVVLFGGTTDLRSTAVIEGELVSIGGTVSREEGAQVRGGESQGFEFDRGRWLPWRTNIPFFEPVLWWYENVFRAFLTSIAVGLLALVVVSLWPEPTSRVSAAITSAPVAAGGLGLLTLVAVPVLLALLTLTLCLIPVAFLGAVVFAAALLFGLIALGQMVGARLATALRMYHLSPAVSAAIGTSLLWLVTSAVGAVACVGWVAWVVLASVGLGAVTLTRFGTRPYFASVAPPPPAPPALPPEAGEAPLAS